MPASKAELVVECRQIMLGTPYKMPLSGMKLHELHAAKETLLKMKADHTKALSDIPVVGPGRPKPRPVEFVEQEGEDGEVLRVPQPPAPRLKKAPLVNNISPDRPTGRPPKVKKEVSIEEPLKGKSAPATYCPCNCRSCPHKQPSK